LRIKVADQGSCLSCHRKKFLCGPEVSIFNGLRHVENREAFRDHNRVHIDIAMRETTMYVSGVI